MITYKFVVCVNYFLFLLILYQFNRLCFISLPITIKFLIDAERAKDFKIAEDDPLKNKRLAAL